MAFKVESAILTAFFMAGKSVFCILKANINGAGLAFTHGIFAVHREQPTVMNRVQNLTHVGKTV